MKIFEKITFALIAIVIITSCKDDEFGKHTDIEFPIPVVNSITENPMVGDTIIITGENFITPNSVNIDGISMIILKEDSAQIQAILPRVFQTAPLVVKNALLRYSDNSHQIMPQYPSADEITVTSWPTEIVRGRPLIIRGENMDLVTQVTIGGVNINVDGLTQQQERLLILVPSSITATSSSILLTTVINSTITSPTELNIIDADPNWVPIDPVSILDFEDGYSHYLGGEIPNPQSSAQINRDGIISPQGSNFFSLHVSNITDPYSMWSYLGSIKVTPQSPIDLSLFHDPYISFLWNSSDNIGSFQIAITQGSAVAGGTFSPGKTNVVVADSDYAPNAKYDQWTLRPTDGEWVWITAKLSDLMIENWGGGFTGFDNYGQINTIELIFKQINGVFWNGLYSGEIYGEANNHDFKANIDQIIITDGPYIGNYIPKQ